MGITNDVNRMTLSVADFGPIAEARIDLRPLTVFIGPSNTGKSYMAILIYALQRFFVTYSLYLRNRGRYFGRRNQQGEPQASKSDFNNLTSEEIESVLEWASELNLERPSMWRQTPIHPELPDSVASVIRPVLKEVIQFNQTLDDEIARCFGVEQISDLIRYPTGEETRVSLYPTTQQGLEVEGSLRHQATFSAKGTRIETSIPEDVPLRIGERTRISDIFSSRWRLQRGVNSETEGARRVAELVGNLSSAVISNMVNPVAGSAYYLPADRAGVMHAHRVVVRSLIARASRAALRPEPPLPALSGVLGDFLEELIDITDVAQDSENSTSDLSARMEETILHGSVLLEETETGYPSFAYRPRNWGRNLPLMSASSMVSEMAPVVLYLRHLVEPGDLLIIEEPESHLHPEMQVAFTRELASIVKSGIHVIVTTHSEWVLEELANLVLLSELPNEGRTGIPGSENALTPYEVGAWLFEPSGPDGASVVEEIHLDRETGTFPARYGLVSEDLYNRFATISNRIEGSQWRRQ